ncbi:SCP2 sterol-binding domain-containing protein [Denitratisoma sp. agr-D3]
MTRSLTIPDVRLPAMVASIGRALPQWPHALGLTTGLNAAAKMKLLARDSLALLENRSFLVEVLDTGSSAHFAYRRGRFLPIFAPTDSPDLILRANLTAFLKLLARQEDPDTLFFRRELSIEGDTELGLAVKNMLDAIEWPAMPAFLTRLKALKPAR